MYENIKEETQVLTDATGGGYKYLFVDLETPVAATGDVLTVDVCTRIRSVPRLCNDGVELLPAGLPEPAVDGSADSTVSPHLTVGRTFDRHQPRRRLLRLS